MLPAIAPDFSFFQQWTALIICLLGSAGLLAQQPDSLELVQTLPIPVSFATTDNLGNVYVLNVDNALEKYNAEGKRLARYSNNRLGPASSIDASNPLKLLVWYAEFRTVVFLDRSLTELGILSLDAAGFSVVRNVATSFDGNLWVYDEAVFKLKKIDPAGMVLFETPALNQLLTTPPTADGLREIGNQVYLADQRQGIFIFDQYASLLTTWNEPVGQDFYVAENQRYTLTEKNLKIRSIGPFAETMIALPGDINEKSRFRLNEQRLLIWDERGVRVFRLP